MTATSDGDDSTIADTEDESAMGADEPAAVARARAQVYALLAATFDGEIDVLRRAMAAGDFARFESVVPGDFDPGALRREDVDGEALRVGYDNLFVVPGPHYVPPFASAHADDPSERFESDSTYHEEGEAGELFGDPAVSVSSSHARFDFDPDRGDGIPDHVAAEFEFVSALASREAALLAGEDPLDPDAPPDDAPGDADPLVAIRRAQRSFLAEEVAWLDDFADAVEREDGAEGVFAAIARFASAFVEWDRQALAEAIDETGDAEMLST
jgi:TorA maturation chaperone TorD